MIPHEGSQSSSLDDILTDIGFGKFQILLALLAGLVQFLDSVEVEMLSYLGPILKCTWMITMWDISLIPLLVFVGMIIGSILYGKLSDIHGRKVILIISTTGVLYFSLLCAASPTFSWLLISRFFVGLFVGGSMSSMFTLYIELMTPKYRAIVTMLILEFWCLGAYYIAVLCVIIVPKFGWRLWLMLPTLPILIIIPFAFWIPESPRYLMVMYKKKEAIQVINRISDMNSANHILNIRNVKRKTISVFQLFHPNYAVTTVIVCYLFFVTGNTYYSFVFLAPNINQIPRKCLQDINMKSDILQSLNISIDDSCCFTQSWTTMTTVFIAISGELTAYVIGAFIINFVQRKYLIQILLLVIVLVYILLNLCLSPSNMGLLLMFGRGAAAILFVTNYVYASEVFPTTIRGLAIGFCNFSSKFGSTFTSLIVNILMIHISYTGGTIFYCCLNFIAFLLVFILPYETKDQKLSETVDDDNSELEILGPTENNIK